MTGPDVAAVLIIVFLSLFIIFASIGKYARSTVSA